MTEDRELKEPLPGERSLGAVWLRQRPKSWYWAGAFVLVVAIVVVLLFLGNPEPPPGR